VSTSVYAKPVIPRIIFRPVLATVVLHGLIIYLLTVNWTSTEREITRAKPVPQVINARLVDVSEFKPTPKPKPPAAKPKTKTPAVAKPKPEPKVEPKPTPKPQPKVVPKPAPKAEPKPEPRISPNELAAIARAELSELLAQEAQATATADEMAASFIGLIQQTVIRYWSRPPSARNGMETELAIQLIPTGDVVSVTVIRSSGNTAFDRSAINAVEKAGAFPELQQLSNAEFEKQFRRFRLLFKPEDLRY
jgi:colicin import membrane protein